MIDDKTLKEIQRTVEALNGPIKQWREIAQNVSSVPVVKINEFFPKETVQQIGFITEQFRNNLLPISNAVQEIQSRFESISKELAPNLDQFAQVSKRFIEVGRKAQVH